ncbi:MAG: hypothetical protein ACYTHK_19530 [Planctomycetota bacterium]|jgi:hypothetical protein
MRWCLILILAAPAFAEDIPFSGAMRKASAEDGAVTITVPKRWTDKEKAGDMLIRVYATGSGGHDITVTRESGQGDVDGLRDRYMEHDTSKNAGSSVQKVDEPYFGYRLEIPDRKLTVVRAFAAQGNAGLILTITSRSANYDKYYAKKLAWVASTLTVDGTRTGGYTDSGPSGLPRRYWDDAGAVSIVAPAGWKKIERQGDELVCIARRGKSGEPRLFVNRMTGSASATLALQQVARDWGVNFKKMKSEMLEGNPPRMVVRGREGDWIDYFVGAFDGDVGYTVRLTVRRGSFDKLTPVADAAAKSIAFTNAPYSDPTPPDRDITEDHKKVLTLHAAAEQSGAMGKVGAQFDLFLRVWTRHGVGYDRRAAPLHVVLAAAEDFGPSSSYFGAAPAVYDRASRCIVATPMPKEKVEEWRAALYAAFAEACLHRDLKAQPPVWYRRGLVSCMYAAGLSGGKPDAEIPEYAGRLTQRLGASNPETIMKVWKWTEGDFRKDPTVDRRAHAWGYVHLMLFGKGKVAGAHKKWKKQLPKARNKPPPFVLKGSDGASDLKAHIEKKWGS